MATKTKAKPMSKAGEHGTLYAYSIEYNDGPHGDPGFPPGMRVNKWAYTPEHALEKFAENDDGFVAVKIARMLEDTHPSRWTWHNVENWTP
jgi:hypothetical protein